MPIAGLQERRDYHRKWFAKRRADWFEGKACVDCGGTDDMELDHVDRDQKLNHRIWSWSEERRNAELAKCVPRCHKCHRRKTDEEMRTIRKRFRHGTTYSYLDVGCRCADCRDFYRQWRRDKYERIGK